MVGAVENRRGASPNVAVRHVRRSTPVGSSLAAVIYTHKAIPPCIPLQRSSALESTCFFAAFFLSVAYDS